MTAKWVGDCFIYTTTGNRINYFVGNESYTIGPSDTYVLLSRCTSSATYRHTTGCTSQTRTCIYTHTPCP
ncbi:hypothetical protein EV363DRAFT_1366915 [Boletus edulis]|nr:hypothetical protein EV363DRAFT_1366915 [Boletus edulis]